jgi:N-methylhydantoinase B
VLITGRTSNGSVFVSGEATAIGWGAYAGGDGTSACIDSMGGDLKNRPVETMEAGYPILILAYRLRQGSAGAGARRGGLGVERVYEVRAHGSSLTLWFERSKMPGWGLCGGRDGVPPEVIVRHGGQERRLWKVNHMPVAWGTRVHARTGGGGGFGRPLDRDPERVRQDCVDGYITQEEAARDYEVYLSTNALEVDPEKTTYARIHAAQGPGNWASAEIMGAERRICDVDG